MLKPKLDVCIKCLDIEAEGNLGCYQASVTAEQRSARTEAFEDAGSPAFKAGVRHRFFRPQVRTVSGASGGSRRLLHLHSVQRGELLCGRDAAERESRGRARRPVGGVGSSSIKALCI